jgi:hypothetical protein
MLRANNEAKNGRAWLTALILLVWCISRASAEGERLVATVDYPVIIYAMKAPSAEHRPAARVVLTVIAYTPPVDGSVQAVVKAIDSEAGTAQEVGRFGLFPDVEFRADNPSNARRFAFPLPPGGTGDKPLKLEVEIVPLTGEGQNACLELGSAYLL